MNSNPFITTVALAMMLAAGGSLQATTTLAQYDFVVTGKNYTAPDSQTIAVGTLFFQDDDNLIVKIANASTVDGYLTGFFMLNPGADPILYHPPITGDGGSGNKQWQYLDALPSSLTGSGSPIASSDAEAYFGAEIQGNPGINGIPNDPDAPYAYHYFTFSFADLDKTAIENVYTNPEGALPILALRWRGVDGDPGSDKGYFFGLSTLVIVPEPRLVGLLSVPVLGALLALRRRRRR